MFCKKCGQELNDNADVCLNCGSLVKKDENTNLNDNKGNKSKAASALLAFFLGGFGVHNFYMGHTKRGAVQLLLTISAIVLAIVSTVLIAQVALQNPGLTEEALVELAAPYAIYMILAYIVSAIVCIWAFIEFILILCGVMKDKQGKALR
ncbi:MAG: NINE protein [Christensenellales bacterium]